MIDQPNTPGRADCARKKSRLGNFIGRFIRDRRGNMGPLIALMLVPLIGVIGVASETGSWFMVQRSMQNAADSAAIAAATNGSTTTTDYRTEGLSVSANYGFTNGASNTTVTVVNNDNSVPAVCNSACYRVTISRNVPIYLTQIVGFTGSVALNGGRAQTVSTFAVATPNNVKTTYCVLSLGTTDDYHINGGPNVNLNGCYVRTNGDTTCNGANASGNAGLIVYGPSGKNKGCSPSQKSTAVMADPYSGLASNIPGNNGGCGTTAAGYKQESAGKFNTLLGGTVGVVIYCGDTKVTGPIGLSASTPGTSAIVIEDGTLDLGGNTLTDVGVPIIFTGPVVSGLSPNQYPTGGGTLDITAPTSGAWSGVAMYQSLDPSISTVDITYAGNTPIWNITGLVYMPKANLTFSGAVGKGSSGALCMSIVDYTIQLNGTGSIFANSQSACAQAGLTPPTDTTPVRVSLVQ